MRHVAAPDTKGIQACSALPQPANRRVRCERNITDQSRLYHQHSTDARDISPHMKARPGSIAWGRVRVILQTHHKKGFSTGIINRSTYTARRGDVRWTFGSVLCDSCGRIPDPVQNREQSRRIASFRVATLLPVKNCNSNDPTTLGGAVYW